MEKRWKAALEIPTKHGLGASDAALLGAGQDEAIDCLEPRAVGSGTIMGCGLVHKATNSWKSCFPTFCQLYRSGKHSTHVS
jgi:hypothetical protein